MAAAFQLRGKIYRALYSQVFYILSSFYFYDDLVMPKSHQSHINRVTDEEFFFPGRIIVFIGGISGLMTRGEGDYLPMLGSVSV